MKEMMYQLNSCLCLCKAVCSLSYLSVPETVQISSLSILVLKTGALTQIDLLGTGEYQAVIHLIHVKRKIINPFNKFDQIVRGVRTHTTHFLAWELSSYDAYNN